MKYSKWIGLLGVITVVVSCFMWWVYVPSVQLHIGGLFADGKHNFGKPGLLNIACSAAAALFFSLPRIWAKRTNIFFCGFNLAWAIRNFILFSRCYGGDCPVKQPALYALLLAAVVMLIMSFLPDLPVDSGKPSMGDKREAKEDLKDS